MHPVEAFLAELEQEAATTRRVLEHLPENKYEWRAHEKGMSISELGGHISSIFEAMPSVLGGQLSAYLRAAGEIVPPVYGPTADIDPFAA